MLVLHHLMVWHLTKVLHLIVEYSGIKYLLTRESVASCGGHRTSCVLPEEILIQGK